MSFKDTFQPDTFAANTFASGTFRGKAAATPPPDVALTVSEAFRHGRLFVTYRQQTVPDSGRQITITER
jgi:hypothetical protein